MGHFHLQIKRRESYTVYAMYCVYTYMTHSSSIYDKERVTSRSLPQNVLSFCIVVLKGSYSCTLHVHVVYVITNVYNAIYFCHINRCFLYTHVHVHTNYT